MKALFTALFITSLLTTSFAKDGSTDSWNITPTIQSHFLQQYKEAENVRWESINGLQKANFTMKEVRYTAFYDRQGEYIATTTMITQEKLPKSTSEKIKSQFKDYTIGQIVEYNNGNTLYFVKLINAKESFMVRVMPNDSIHFFKSL